MAVYVTIRIPSDTKWSPSAASGLVTALTNQYCTNWDDKKAEVIPIELEIYAYPGLIEWAIFVYGEDNPQKIIDLVHSFYPSAIVKHDVIELPRFPCYRHSGILFVPDKLSPVLPLYQDAKDLRAIDDPLIQVTNAMNLLEEGETLCYQLRLYQIGRVKRGIFNRMLISVLEEAQRRQDPFKRKPQNEIKELIDEKIKNTIIGASFAVHLYTQSKERFYILENVLSGITRLSDWGVFDYSYRRTSSKINNEEEFFEVGDGLDKLNRKEGEAAMHNFTADELASMWHLPYAEFTASKIGWTPTNRLPEPLQGIDGILLGESYGLEVRMPESERDNHTVIGGKTGSGKSSLMHSMIHADIAEGKGLCAVDPQGGMIKKILRHSIPDDRINDVVLLSFGNRVDGMSFPPPLNPLYKTGDGEISLGFLNSIRQLDPDFAGTQMEDYLELALMTLGLEYQPTLQDIRRLFRDDNFRQMLIARIDDEELEEEWERAVGGEKRCPA